MKWSVIGKTISLAVAGIDSATPWASCSKCVSLVQHLWMYFLWENTQLKITVKSYRLTFVSLYDRCWCWSSQPPTVMSLIMLLYRRHHNLPHTPPANQVWVWLDLSRSRLLSDASGSKTCLAFQLSRLGRGRSLTGH